MKIYCCACGKEVDARLTDGTEIYAHRPDLARLPFWKCDHCGNFVGCHHKTEERTKPLGCIPTPQIKKARQHIHRILDPIWQSGRTSRKKTYRALALMLGLDSYHTAQIRSLDEARTVYRAVQELRGNLL
jgi:hypothetical protein|nr:zinc-finger-containing protein [uncultured Cohaesibacter sp.]